MKLLFDTNVLLRLVQPVSPFQATTIEALLRLEQAGVERHLVPQVIYEFWSVATRPETENGLGMTVANVERSVQQVLVEYPLLREEQGVFEEWLPLVARHEVIGKKAHDARLVAAMQRHGLTHLMTFNVGDFDRFPGVTAFSPTDIAAGRLPTGWV